GQMYKNPEHQSIVDLPLAMAKGQLSVKWDHYFSGLEEGGFADFKGCGQPIVAGDYLYNTAGNKIFKMSLQDGTVVAEHEMVGSIGFFSMIAYGEGKIFVPLEGGVLQAFDALTLEPLWQSKVESGTQHLSPIVYHDGYIYTGTWSGGSRSTGVYYCLTAADEEPDMADEIKTPVWQSASTGFYWCGGTIVGDCIFVGGDDGTMHSYNRLTGAVVDEWEVAPGLAKSYIRSGTSYDKTTGRLFFTGREAKKIYSVKINPDGTFDETSKRVADVSCQATTTPTVYNGRVYVTSGTMDDRKGGLDVYDAETLDKIYTVDIGGISQSTPVINTAFATEENGHEIYIYVCLNTEQGSLVCIRDFEGNTVPLIQYKWNAPMLQYSTHSMVMDQYGTMYYRNDTKGFWALGSAGVSLNRPVAKVNVGAELALHPRVVTTQPDKSVSWASTNPSVATVNADGVVTGVTVGTAKIVVTTAAGGFSDTCAVTVCTPLTAVTLAQATAEINVGDERTLNVSVSPAGSQEDVIWKSSDPTVATVSQTGVVTAVAAGAADITVGTGDGRLTQTCRVTVVPVPVTGVDVAAPTTIVGKNGLQLTATVAPQNATNKNVSWTSSDETIATVSETGMVSALMPGSVTVTATTEDGGFTATKTLTVDIVPVTGVSLDKKTLALIYKGSAGSLTATVMPANATFKTVTYTSTDESVATVDGGSVSAKGAGTAKIIVRTEHGNFTDTCVVTVEKIDVVGVSLNKKSLSIANNKTQRLVATITPNNPSDKTLTWTSTDESVATVSPMSGDQTRGTVTPVGNGEAKIIVTTGDGGFTDTCAVSVSNVVSEPVTAVVICSKTATLTLGGSGRMLTAKVLPEEASNKKITWESTDETVATVSAKGVITSIAAGQTFIIVKTVDGGLADTCTVTVKAASVPDDPDTPDDPNTPDDPKTPEDTKTPD
ncbi:MAG: Ig-like domain-containing protein, partial [Bacteroidales bacterium]|nr:Ig-like domain-containing protein [Bacteroidales bacterium]